MQTKHDTAPYWKDDIDDLLARASDVIASPPVRRHQLTASEAAFALVGVVSWIQRMSGADAMQRAAADLARHESAWKTSLAALPHVGGVVDTNVALLALVARGILELAGERNLRAAISYWATESDPAQWRSLVA